MKKEKNVDIGFETYDVEVNNSYNIVDNSMVGNVTDDNVVEYQKKVVKVGFVEWCRKVWNKTVFPDMIRNKREEKALINEIKREARIEAMRDMKDTIKESIIQKEKDKLSGKNKKDFWNKLAKGFGADGDNGLNTSDKLNMMLGDSKDSKQFDVLGQMGVSDKKKLKDPAIKNELFVGLNGVLKERDKVDVLSKLSIGSSKNFDINEHLGDLSMFHNNGGLPKGFGGSRFGDSDRFKELLGIKFKK